MYIAYPILKFNIQGDKNALEILFRSPSLLRAEKEKVCMVGAGAQSLPKSQEARPQNDSKIK